MAGRGAGTTRWVMAGVALGLTLATGCGDPCEKLAEKVCAYVDDPKACERSRRDMKDFGPEVCRDALEIFERVYEK